MPLYEYRCDACGKSFEKMTAFAHTAQIPECPHCGSPQTRKKISTFSSRVASGGSSSSSSSNCGGGGRFT